MKHSDPRTDENDRSDAELVVAAQGGDRKAFVDIVARHQGMVTAVTLAVLGNFSAGEDAAQEAFVAAWQKIGSLEDPAKLRPWLGTIARNTAISHLRRQRPGESLDASGRNIADKALGPDEVIANEDDRAAVLAALEALPEKFRLPMVLFYRQEESVRSVAETLGLSEDVVKKRLAKGRELLRDRMLRLIGSVVGDALPGALFTATVASLIGAMLQPSAIAATAFTAGEIAKPVVATATAMTASKLTLTTAALIAGLCIPAGYTAHLALDSGKDQATASTREDSTSEIAELGVEAESEIAAEWRRLREQFGEGPDALSGLYAAIDALPNALRRRAFHTLLPIEWASVDPSQAITFYRSDDRPDWQSELLIDTWLKLDPNRALDALITSGPGWEPLAKKMLVEIATAVPSRLVEVASLLRLNTDGYLANAFAIFGENDPAAAVRAAHELTGEQRESALSGVASGWAKRDPQAALAWAQSLESRASQNDATTSVLYSMALQDPLAALDHIGQVTFGWHLSSEIMRKAAAADFDATLTWVREHPGQISTLGMAAEVGKRLKNDPIALLGAFENQGALPVMLSSLKTQKSLRTATETQALVWQWLLEPERSSDAALLRESMILRADYADPLHIMTLVDQLPVGPERDKMMRDVASGVISDGEDPFEQTEPTAVHRTSGARLDATGMHKLIETAPAGWQETLIETGFAGLWLGQFAESEHLSAWVDRVAHLSDDSRAEGIEKMAGALAMADAEGMEAFHSGLPEAEREAAAIAFIRVSSNRDPAIAWPWLDRVDPSQRYALVSDLLQPIAAKDRVLAKSWLDQAPITPAERDALIRNQSLNR